MRGSEKPRRVHRQGSHREDDRRQAGAAWWPSRVCVRLTVVLLSSLASLVDHLDLARRRAPQLGLEGGLQPPEHRTLGLPTSPEQVQALITLFGGTLLTLVTGPPEAVTRDGALSLARIMVTGTLGAIP